MGAEERMTEFIPEELDRYFYWLHERETIRIRKEERRDHPPWTQDPILQEFKFCQVFREDDRTTRWFRTHMRDPLQDKPEVLMATIIFRWFNLIETGRTLLEHNLHLEWDRKKAIEEITWDGSKDWERTWEGKIYNEILIENAQKIENRIDTYLIKRVEHGLDLTDEMKNFKGYDVIRMERQPISPLPPPEAQEPDAEKSVMVSKIKHLSKEKKKLANALKIMRHKPTETELAEIIDRCRFKNGKCNNTKVGEELGIDGETALSWIKKLGLSDYAYNPKHEI